MFKNANTMYLKVQQGKKRKFSKIRIFYINLSPAQ